MGCGDNTFDDSPEPQASAKKSTISASPVSIAADGISTSTITVQLKNANGDYLFDSASTTVQLDTTDGALSTIADNADGTFPATLKSPPISGVAMITGEIGEAGGTATPQLLADSATVTFTSVVVSVSATTIMASSASIAADGIETSTITVQLRNEQGDALHSNLGIALRLSTTNGALSVVNDHANGTFTAILKASTRPGVATITGEIGESSTSPDFQPIPNSATVTFHDAVISASATSIAASPLSIAADGISTSTITVQLKNANGNDLHVSMGTMVRFNTTAGALTAVTDHGDGTFTAILRSPAAPGEATIGGQMREASALTDFQPFPHTVTVTFTEPVVSASATAITASPPSIAADGISTSTITVQLRNEDGDNLHTNMNMAVQLDTTAGALSPIVDHANGTFTAILTSPTSPGVATITGEIGDVNGTGASQPVSQIATVAFTQAMASVNATIFTASPTSIAADGVSNSTLTMQLRNADGDDLHSNMGQTVRLTATGGSLSAVIDHADGTFTATLTSPMTAGTATVMAEIGEANATADYQSISDIATVTFTPATLSLSATTITVSPPSIAADGISTSTLTLQLRNVFGDDLHITFGKAVRLNTTVGALSEVTDHANGTYTAILTSPLSPGNATITGEIGEADAPLSFQPIPGTATVSLTGTAVSVEATTITASPPSIAADGIGTSSITVQLKNTHGDDLRSNVGMAIRLSTTAGALSPVTDHADGTFTATLTSPTSPGVATITGEIGDVNGTGASQPVSQIAAVAFTQALVSVNATMIAASPTSIAADGIGTSTITVHLKNANGDDLHTNMGMAIRLNTTGGVLSAVTDHADGTFTATLTSPMTTGSATITVEIGEATATADYQSISDITTVNFTLAILSANATTITASPSSIEADGIRTSAIIVQLRNAHGAKLHTNMGIAARLNTTAGALSSVTDHGDGTFEATLTSPTSPGVAIITGKILDPNGTGASQMFPETATVSLNKARPIVFVRDEEIYLTTFENLIRLSFNQWPEHHPILSPDGTKIVFSRTHDQERDIFMMDIDGSNEQQLTSGGENVMPSWSFDGDRIAFSSDRDGNFEIYVMDADGSNHTRVTTRLKDDFHPTFSPDGTAIAFEALASEPWYTTEGVNYYDYEIFVINVDGSSDPVNLSNSQSDNEFSPSWSPDGTRIAFSSDEGGIMLMDADNGSNRTAIASTTQLQFTCESRWSPDGKRMIFEGIAYQSNGHQDIYIVDLEAAERLVNLTNSQQLTELLGGSCVPNLGNRETPLPIYVPRVLNAATDARVIRVITFVANHTSEYYIGPMSIDARAPERVAAAITGSGVGANGELIIDPGFRCAPSRLHFS